MIVIDAKDISKEKISYDSVPDISEEVKNFSDEELIYLNNGAFFGGGVGGSMIGNAGSFDAFLRNFFLAIHSRYDIEQPVVQRYIRRKLGIITRQQTRISELQDEISRREALLKRLAVEYTLLGKECEQEQMNEAAIRNYEKALELCPDHPDALRRLKKLRGKK